MNEYKSRQLRARPRRRQRIVERFANALLGLMFVLFGVGLIWLPRAGHLSPQTAYAAVVLTWGLGAFIALFGCNLVWQSVRGEPTAHGFLIRSLLKIGATTAPCYVLLALLGFAAVSVSIGFGFSRDADTRFGFALLAGWVSAHFQVLFHEYGHWLAASACEYRPFRVAGGAFAARLHDGRWKIGLNREWGYLLGGAVVSAPPERARSWTRDLCVTSAGPLASALLLYVCLQVPPLLRALPVLKEWIAGNAQWAAVILVLNLVPLRAGVVGPHPTDGYQLLRLLRSR